MPGWSSDRQRRAIYASAHGKSKIGMSKATAKKIVAHGGPGKRRK